MFELKSRLLITIFSFSLFFLLLHFPGYFYPAISYNYVCFFVVNSTPFLRCMCIYVIFWIELNWIADAFLIRNYTPDLFLYNYYASYIWDAMDFVVDLLLKRIVMIHDLLLWRLGDFIILTISFEFDSVRISLLIIYI